MSQPARDRCEGCYEIFNTDDRRVSDAKFSPGFGTLAHYYHKKCLWMRRGDYNHCSIDPDAIYKKF